jgi:probable rRNA maturation factor
MAAIYLPPWRIDVDRRPGVEVPTPLRALALVAARALDAAKAPRPASLGLILSDDRELAALNAEHMGEKGPTDVLSFPFLPPSAFPAHAGQNAALSAAPGPQHAFALPPGRRLHLGDVVVSVERATEQAREGHGGQSGDVRWSAADELRLLVAHGVLHICGWDHVRPEEAEAMRRLERDVLGS